MNVHTHTCWYSSLATFPKYVVAQQCKERLPRHGWVFSLTSFQRVQYSLELSLPPRDCWESLDVPYSTFLVLTLYSHHTIRTNQLCISWNIFVCIRYTHLNSDGCNCFICSGTGGVRGQQLSSLPQCTLWTEHSSESTADDLSMTTSSVLHTAVPVHKSIRMYMWVVRHSFCIHTVGVAVSHCTQWPMVLPLIMLQCVKCVTTMRISGKVLSWKLIGMLSW